MAVAHAKQLRSRDLTRGSEFSRRFEMVKARGVRMRSSWGKSLHWTKYIASYDSAQLITCDGKRIEALRSA
jgi:hypothetical protein